MSFWFAASAGLHGLGALMSYGADSASAKAQKKMQKYRNTMTALAGAASQNAITTNTVLAQQQSARQAVFMRRDELSTLGSSAVAAAAAGVRGNSVNQTMRDIQRNAATQERMRQVDLEQQWLQFDQQRLSVAFSQEQNMDYSYIPTPKLGSYLLGAAINMGSQYAMKKA